MVGDGSGDARVFDVDVDVDVEGGIEKALRAWRGGGVGWRSGKRARIMKRYKAV